MKEVAFVAKRVLVADDDELVATALRRILRRAGFTVDVVSDGKSAAERLMSGAYDALVTDWMMPELDGIELVRQARAGFAPLYVALLSGLDTPAARAHALEAGANDFFAKPNGILELASAMSAWFDRPPAEPAKAAEVHAHPVLGTRAWAHFPMAAQRIMTRAIGTPWTVAPAAAQICGEAIACELPLADVVHALDMRVVVQTSRASAAAIHRMLLGHVAPSDAESLCGVLSELANLVGGVVKTSFAAEGYEVTLGLPRRVDVPPREFAFTCAVGLTADGFDAVVRLDATPRSSETIEASELREDPRFHLGPARTVR
jgi:CheY-like chemotaxis protein